MIDIKVSVDDRAETPSRTPSASQQALAMMEATLDWAYDKALNGVPGLGTLDEFVASYTSKATDPEQAMESLIKWQLAKAGTVGFVTGLGGLVTLPAAIPANIAWILYLQLRLIAGVAKLRGYDVRGDQVRTMCIACLAGSAVADVLKDVGIKLGSKLTQQAIARISGATLIRINKAVGFRLVTKAGSTGMVNLTKMVQFLDGFVGGTFDVGTTRGIAIAAKSVFARTEATEGEERERTSQHRTSFNRSRADASVD
jgi:hypothetical protein